MVIDSNTIIYSAQPDHGLLARVFRREQGLCFRSRKIEVLGYHKLQPNERVWFEQFFDEFELVRVSTTVINRAVELRQQRKMSLGDSIIAATALELDGELATRNVADFKWIEGLVLINPFDLQTESSSAPIV